MRRCVTYYLVLLYLAAGVAPALHTHEHAHVLRFGPPIIGELKSEHSPETSGGGHHERCHHGDDDPARAVGQLAEEHSGHQHHAPLSPHDHSDDCVVCQNAVQATAVAESVPALTFEGLYRLVEEPVSSFTASAEFQPSSVRGPLIAVSYNCNPRIVEPRPCEYGCGALGDSF